MGRADSGGSRREKVSTAFIDIGSSVVKLSVRCPSRYQAGADRTHHSSKVGFGSQHQSCRIRLGDSPRGHLPPENPGAVPRQSASRAGEPDMGGQRPCMGGCTPSAREGTIAGAHPGFPKPAAVVFRPIARVPEARRPRPAQSGRGRFVFFGSLFSRPPQEPRPSCPSVVPFSPVALFATRTRCQHPGVRGGRTRS
jgi:hypothetical protein